MAAVLLICVAGTREGAASPAAAAEAPRPDASFRVPGVGIDLLWIKPGSFKMPGAEARVGHSRAVGPATEVALSRGYWLAKTELTQAQWEAVMGYNHCEFRGDDRPVDSVSWNDAVAFCAKLTELERAAKRLPADYVYALPTEAQWEYACLGGGAIPSDSNLGQLAWYNYRIGNGLYGTHPVGLKKPNAWGLYDMLGNVWEWCLDRNAPYPGGYVEDYIGDSPDLARVVKGGGWEDQVEACRPSSRAAHPAYESDGSIGFRVALAWRETTLNADQRAAERSSAMRRLALKERVRRLGELAPFVKRVAADIGDLSYTVPEIRMRMIWIEPGTFVMGSRLSEEGRNSDESPPTRVTLSRGFWIGETEVTQSEWERAMDRNPSQFRGEDLPVDSVTWDDAMEFGRRLTAREQMAGRLPPGYAYTLPREAQWEYACRAGTAGLYGGTLEEMAWFGELSGDHGPHPVRQKRPNAWGLYDMHGNVWEWCHDRFGPYPGGTATDYVRDDVGTTRVLRGGSWQSGPVECRSAARYKNRPGNYFNDRGFRIALIYVGSACRP